MESDSPDTPQETDTSEVDETSHLGAAKTTIKSFAVKKKSYQKLERVDGAGHMSSKENVPSSRLQKSETHDMRLIQQNFYQIRQQFGNVTVEGARNLTIGGTQNIGKPGPSPQEEKPPTFTEKIKKRTASRIEDWTRGMVETSALTRVMDKLTSGVTWITIKGSPGEGKSTAAYMALKKLHQSERQVFQVISPKEFSEITTTCFNPVIMLDDIFGNLEFDEAEWSRWKALLHQVLDGKEHRSHERARSLPEADVTVLLVGRDYVLNSACYDMGRISSYFNSNEHVVSLSSSDERDIKEKAAIWRAISESSDVELDEDTIDQICHINVPHGFPYVCHLFARLYKQDASINVCNFFMKPLEFLNQTIEKFIRDKAKLFLFKELVKTDGKLNIRELESMDDAPDSISDVVDGFLGTYLRIENDSIVFYHQSVYDSVAFILCKRYPSLIIKNCKLSFIHERLRLEQSPNSQHLDPRSESGLVIHIQNCYLKELRERFAAEMSNKNFKLVLSHKAFSDKMFTKDMMASIALQLRKYMKAKDSTTGEHFLCLIASNKSNYILEYIDNHTDIKLTPFELTAVLHGVCRYVASDVLTYLVDTRDTFDINARCDCGKTPLIVASLKKDGNFVGQVMSLNPDLNASDNTGTTVLHYLCGNGLTTAIKQVIDSGIDINIMDRNGRSSMWYACSNNQEEVVGLLLDRGARIDDLSVFEACFRGKMNVIDLLFQKGASVNTSFFYRHPLIAACERGHLNAARFLIEKGAFVNNPDRLFHAVIHHVGCKKPQSLHMKGVTIEMQFLQAPIDEACMGGHVKLMRFLIGKGASVNTVDKTNLSPLHVACLFGQAEAVECLLEHTADIDSEDEYGNRPLHTASEMGYSKCVAILLKTGADSTVLNTLGSTPLHKAAQRGSIVCLEMLIKAGVNVNTQNSIGYTPLHEAATSGYRSGDGPLIVNPGSAFDTTCGIHTPQRIDDDSEIVFNGPNLPDVSVFQTLITHSADVNIQDQNGNTPLHLLSRSSSETAKYHPSTYKDVYITLVTLLSHHGADKKMLNKKGETAIHGWLNTLAGRQHAKTGKDRSRKK